MESGLITPTSSHKNWSSKGGHVNAAKHLSCLLFYSSPEERYWYR